MNTYYVAGIPYSDELFHHGIKGQKWGIRRYQNPDGTYTSEGKSRYGVKNDRQASRLDRYQNKEYEKAKKYYELESKMYDKRIEKLIGKRDKALSNLNINKGMRISNNIKNYEERAKNSKKIGEQVLKNIKNMTVKDMNREKLIFGSSIVGSMLATAGLVATSPYTGVAGFVVLDAKGNVRNNRESIASKMLSKR